MVFGGTRFVVAAEPSRRVAKPADTVRMLDFNPLTPTLGGRIEELGDTPKPPAGGLLHLPQVSRRGRFHDLNQVGNRR